MGKDLRYGLRALARSPRFTLTAIAVLALGIGANSAIFSLVYSVLLRPLPYHQPGRIGVLLASSSKRAGAFSLAPAEYLDFRDGSRSFAAMAAAELWGPSLTGEGAPEELHGLRASASLFDVLGVAAQVGRTFRPEEERPGAAPVVVIGAGLWKRRFGGDAGAVGRTITLNKEAYTIIGVMPEGFYFPPFWASKAEIYTPLIFTPAKAHDRNTSTLRVFARLKPGVRWEQARADVERVAADMAAAHPGAYTNQSAVLTPVLQMSVGSVKSSLVILLGAVGCTLLIACANLANLFLARGVGRQKEIAIRQALGASRLALVRQMLTESLLLSVGGGLLGLALARWMVGAFVAGIPGTGGFQMPRQSEIALGWPVALFHLGVCLLAGVAFGLAPGLAATRTSVNHWLKQAVRGSTGDRTGLRIRSTLVAVEVALALMLLAGAGLLIESFRNLRNISPGFDAHNVVAISTAVAGSVHAAPERRASFYREAVERFRSMPGVVTASAVNHAPMVGDTWRFTLEVEGQPPLEPANRPSAIYRVALPDYFRTIGMQLAMGRDFNERDREGAPPVAIVNETMARHTWPGQNPVGKRFRLPKADGDAPWMAVTGVLRDTRQQTWTAPVQDEMYLPFLQSGAYLHDPASFRTMTFVVRTAGAPSALAPALREQIRAIDAGVPVTSEQPMEQALEDAVWQPRLEMSVLAAFAGLALLLATVGIYAVMSYVVGGRTQEIGIRMALGAKQSDVLRMVLGQSLKPVAIGMAAGIAGTAALAQVMEKLLFEVKPGDPRVLAAVVVILGTVALLAGLAPALRASRIDPLAALRED